MIDVKNTQMRYVTSPLGKGWLNCYDSDKDMYGVRLSRKDCPSIEGPCAHKFYRADELDEVKDGNKH